MKKIGKALVILTAVSLFTAFSQVNDVLKIGELAPATSQEVEDTSGRTLTLENVAGDNGLLVMFTCNTCPWVAKWEDRFNSLATLADENDVGMIALNPNERIRDRGESMADMRTRAQKKGYNFPYAMDKNHVIADAFGATRTPEVFLFDSDLKLVYHGAIDDNANSASGVKTTYVEDAVQELMSGNSISTEKTKLPGCTIKRNE